MPENFAINVRRLSYGWETIQLVFDDTTVEFLASYLGCEPLSNLIENIKQLLYIPHYSTTWTSEPAYMKIDFSVDEKREVLEVLIETDFQLPDDEVTPFRYQFEVRFDVFKAEVIRAGLDVLRTYGVVGIDQSWSDGPNVFPIATLLRLMGMDATYHEESGSYRTDFGKELEMLTSQGK